jgi:predicted permease
MVGLIEDFRVASRSLLKRPGFAAAVLLTLALGIGANTALFGVFRSVFLAPLPFPDSDRLTFVMQTGSFGCCGPASGPDYLDWEERHRSFSEIGAIRHILATLTGDAEAERLRALAVTASVFDVLEGEAALGRVLVPADQASPSVVVLSHWLWESRFGSDPQILGRTVVVNGRPLEVVGVMPEGFDVLSPWNRTGRFALYQPFADSLLAVDRGSHSYPVVARLAPGVAREAAEADMQRVMRELAEEYPQTNEDRSARVFTAHEYLYGDVGRMLGLVLGAAALVLLVACGNVAGLQVARATAREAELTVRAALGASKAAIIRLMFTESAVLAGLGGLLGIGAAMLVLQGLRAVLPANIPRLDAIALDGSAFLFALAAAALTALVFGLVPALLVSSRDLAAGLREGGYATLAPRKERLRDGFIVAQIAMGLVLANGAGLLVQSYQSLRSQELGFEQHGMLTLQVMPAGERYPDHAARADYFERVSTQAASVPGVRHAGWVSKLPLNGGSNSNVLVEGRGPRSNSNEGPLVEMSFVAGDYFAAAGIELLQGRTLIGDDSVGANLGAVINRTMAERVWPGDEALGKRFSVEDEPPEWITVVGVVEDVRQWSLESAVQNEAYLHAGRSWSAAGYLTLRTDRDAAALVPQAREAVLAVDPALPPSDIHTMVDRVEGAFSQRRFYTTLISLFAAAALFLAAAGVYGTVSYYVSRRIRELGIRMALGGGTGEIVGLVLRRGSRLAVWGVAAGLLGAWASTRLVEGMLYGVGPVDALTLVTGGALLTAVALGASAWPASRAARLSPVLALRAE